jgi:hypothetical protein
VDRTDGRPNGGDTFPESVEHGAFVRLITYCICSERIAHVHCHYHSSVGIVYRVVGARYLSHLERLQSAPFRFLEREVVVGP